MGEFRNKWFANVHNPVGPSGGVEISYVLMHYLRRYLELKRTAKPYYRSVIIRPLPNFVLESPRSALKWGGSKISP